MGWLLSAVAAVVAGVVLLVVVGASLPVEHVARIRVLIDQAPLDVFAAIRDVTGAKEWRTGLKKVEVLSKEGEPLRWKEYGAGGAITFLREEAVPPQKLVYRIDDAKLPFGGRWIFDLRPEGKGTLVVITEEGTVRNPVYRLMSRYVFGYYRTLEQYARDLGQHFEEQV